MSSRLLLPGLVLLTLILLVLSLLTGPAGLGFWLSIHAILGGGNEASQLVMQEIRLPRALLGLMVGATLGLSGAVLQGFLRNPLADPGVLGISSSASLGAVLAIYTGLSSSFEMALPLMATGGAIFAVFVLQLLSGRTASSLTLILAGIAIASMASALTSLALNMSSNPFAALEILFWMLGSLNDRSLLHLLLAAPLMLVGWIMLIGLGRGLDALTLGNDVATSLGANINRMRHLMILGTAIAVGSATAVVGAIGFIGLVVPHLLRPLVGAQPGRLLIPSMFGGASLLLAADIAVRVIAPERDLKLGVLTALIGAPFFFWLVLKNRREMV